MNINKSAFIIPVYPPHYNFLDFINKLNDNLDFDIILVLSFKNDFIARAFARFVRTLVRFKL